MIGFLVLPRVKKPFAQGNAGPGIVQVLTRR
jgi:hypothetical protein